jgi:hypothetical protein
MNSFDPFASVGSVLLSIVVLLVSICWIVAPLYVISIHTLLKRKAKLDAENAKRLEMMQLHLAQLKKRWLEEE